MTTEITPPGPYTLKKLGFEAMNQFPSVASGFPELVHSFKGPFRIHPRTRLAVQLRYARLMGCPVCAKLIPPLGQRAGLSDEAVESALAGTPDGLTEEQYGAVVWAGELVQNDGNEPADIPEPAELISQLMREQLIVQTRLELLVHSAGLFFLPHSMIERAFNGS